MFEFDQVPAPQSNASVPSVAVTVTLEGSIRSENVIATTVVGLTVEPSAGVEVATVGAVLSRGRSAGRLQAASAATAARNASERIPMLPPGEMSQRV
jgi:hypothetical protein